MAATQSTEQRIKQRAEQLKDEKYLLEERAAILEYEGSFDRTTAERMAGEMMKKRIGG